MAECDAETIYIHASLTHLRSKLTHCTRSRALETADGRNDDEETRYACSETEKYLCSGLFINCCEAACALVVGGRLPKGAPVCLRLQMRNSRFFCKKGICFCAYR